MLYYATILNRSRTNMLTLLSYVHLEFDILPRLTLADLHKVYFGAAVSVDLPSFDAF